MIYVKLGISFTCARRERIQLIENCKMCTYVAHDSRYRYALVRKLGHHNIDIHRFLFILTALILLVKGTRANALGQHQGLATVLQKWTCIQKERLECCNTCCLCLKLDACLVLAVAEGDRKSAVDVVSLTPTHERLPATFRHLQPSASRKGQELGKLCTS